MPKTSRIRGPLAASIDDFIRLLRSLGRQAEEVGRDLRLLDMWLAQRGLAQPHEITSEILWQWKKDQASHLHPLRVRGKTFHVKRFFLYLYSRGYVQTNAAALLPVDPAPHYLPYVFTVDEIHRLLTDGVAALRRPFTRLKAYTLFHLLYATGMRRQEALSLRLEDLDFPQKLLHIRRTKFHKERRIPIGSRVVANLQAYVQARQERFGPLRPVDFIFSSPGPGGRPAGPLTPCRAWHLFDRMLRAIGLRPAHGKLGPSSHGAPRIHSLRHTFCVHRLLKWYREGADLNHKLFPLSTYVGHEGPQYTVVYLRATEALLAEAGKRLGSYLSDIR